MYERRGSAQRNEGEANVSAQVEADRHYLDDLLEFENTARAEVTLSNEVSIDRIPKGNGECLAEILAISSPRSEPCMSCGWAGIFTAQR